MLWTCFGPAWTSWGWATGLLQGLAFSPRKTKEEFQNKSSIKVGWDVFSEKISWFGRLSTKEKTLHTVLKGRVSELVHQVLNQLTAAAAHPVFKGINNNKLEGNLWLQVHFSYFTRSRISLSWKSMWACFQVAQTGCTGNHQWWRSVKGDHLPIKAAVSIRNSSMSILAISADC